MSVKQNIAKIEERIQKACDSAGRKREEITLMAVSKFVPLVKIEEAVAEGIFYFGESRVQEALEKFSIEKFSAEKFSVQKPDAFKDNHPDVKIHMIGSLQRNKAKKVSGFFDCVQSVDRPELIDELAKHTGSLNKPLEIFLELHTGEESKRGFSDLNGLFKAADAALGCPGLKPAGLMTMAPFFKDMSQPDSIKQVRLSFRQVVKAQAELEKRFPGNWNCLSMGMSNDFETAVEEGATMLRIGSLIFNE